MATPLMAFYCRTALAVTLGASLTFALAGPAAAIEDRCRPFGGSRRFDLEFAPASRRSVQNVSWARGTFGERYELDYMASCFPVERDDEHAIPNWVPVQTSQQPMGSLLPPSPGAVLISQTTAAGWPFRAFACTVYLVESENAGPIGTSFVGGWSLNSDHSRLWPRSVIPYKPIWPGLLANLAIYATAASLVAFIGPARRAYRRHRNRCPHCNYARAGLADEATCPECGRAPK